jgi:hypothetical protein
MSGNYKTIYNLYNNQGEELIKQNFDYTQLNDYDTRLAPQLLKEKYLTGTTTTTTTTTTPIMPVQTPVINNDSELTMKYELIEGTGISPDVFGPPFWFTLHNGAAKYPTNPNKIVQKKMKDFIIAIPVMLPCLKCKDHSISYIESNLESLDDIVSSREKLFNFFVDFHNYVNKRYGKKIYSYDEAYNLYNGKVKLFRMSYS